VVSYNPQRKGGRRTAMQSAAGLTVDVAPGNQTPPSIAHPAYGDSWTVWGGNSGRG
jgi:hypothetical protein